MPSSHLSLSQSDIGTEGLELTGDESDMETEGEQPNRGEGDVREAEEEGLDELYGDAVETAGERPASEDEDAEVII